MKIAYVLPTRDRPVELRATLAALGGLAHHGAQVVVVDNGSATRPDVPRMLENGLPVEVVRLRVNAGAAGRNTGVMVSDPACGWVVMLDDDSAPEGLGHLDAVAAAARDVAAIGAEVWLSREGGEREHGGLPEVFIGCGVALRREVFLEAGGYDARLGYYAEEYDLAARLLLGGMRVTMDRRFQVLHRKAQRGRDMDLIVGRLVRNNGWVVQRYAPARRRARELRGVIERYGGIAAKERAQSGYAAGLRELLGTLRSQRRSAMDDALWARFTGAGAARASLERAWRSRGFRTAAVVDEGKNAGVLRAALRGLGVREVADERAADALVIGTMSPGPMLDAWDRRGGWGDPRLVCGWDELVGPAAPGRAVSRAAYQEITAGADARGPANPQGAGGR